MPVPFMRADEGARKPLISKEEMPLVGLIVYGKSYETDIEAMTFCRPCGIRVGRDKARVCLFELRCRSTSAVHSSASVNSILSSACRPFVMKRH